MAEVVTCKESDLRPVVEMLSALIPAGEKGVPVGIHVHDGAMLITCNTGVVYQGRVPVTAIAQIESTVLYTDVAPILSADSEVRFEFDDTTCSIVSDNVQLALNKSYSVLSENEVNMENASQLGTQVLAGIRSILNMHLDRLYSKTVPIEVSSGMCIVKYPNVVVQSRTVGFPTAILLDARYSSLLWKFGGSQWDVSNPTAITAYTDNGSMLSVPCRQSTSTFSVMELLKGMQAVEKLYLTGYGEKMRTLMKLYGKVTCRVAIYNDGVVSTVASANSNATLKVGACTNLVSVFHMPIEPWIVFLSAFREGITEILVGGGKICLRNQELVVVTSTLP